jgi:hypothetical protein
MRETTTASFSLYISQRAVRKEKKITVIINQWFMIPNRRLIEYNPFYFSIIMIRNFVLKLLDNISSIVYTL